MSSNKKSPAFRFYAGDFLRDQNVMLMSLEERGAYITLLASAWIEGSIPNDIDKLARLCSCSCDEMERIWPALEPCFRPKGRKDYKRLTNKRLEVERKKQREYSKKMSENAKKREAQRHERKRIPSIG